MPDNRICGLRYYISLQFAAAAALAMFFPSNAFSRSITWDGTTNPFISSHWLTGGSLTSPAVGDALVVTSGQSFFRPTGPGSITLSSTSNQGQSLSISGGLLFVDQSADGNDVHGLLLDDGASLTVAVPGVQSGMTLDGPLSIGDAAMTSASATLSGGFMSIGWNYLGNPPDQSLYVGKFGSGVVTQSGTATIVIYGTGSVDVAAEPGSSGTYNLEGGTLETNDLYVGGIGNGGAIQPGGTAVFNMTGGTLSTENFYVASGGSFAWSGGTIDVTGSSGLEVGAPGPLGGSVSIGPGQTLGVHQALTIDSNASVSLNGGSLFVGSFNIGNPSALSWGSGTLGVTGAAGLVIGSGGPIGSSFNITSNRALQVSATLTVNPGASLLLNGGSLSVGTLANNTGNPNWLSWNSGTLSVTGSAGWTVGPMIALGSNPSISSNHTLIVTNTLMVPPAKHLSLTGGAMTVGGLNIIGSGFIDVGSDQFYIDYPGSSPANTIIGYLSSGYNDGLWNGPGINSSAANADPQHYGVGFTDAPVGGQDPIGGQMHVAYALYGDLNLDGIVDGTDLSLFASNFGQNVSGWDEGDFNYDGSVNGADFALVANNFGKTTNGTEITLPPSDWTALESFAAAHGLLADLPEPGSLVLAVMGVLGIFGRRRR